MSGRILVAYATRAGSTAQVAEVVGEVLRETGSPVDVVPVKDVRDLTGYAAVVLGSAIWAGKPLPEARQFVDDRQHALSHVPVAYFILCDTLREDTPANRETARDYAGALQEIQPAVSVGMFAGVRDFSKLNPILRWLLKRVMRLQEGDWRNWNQIRAWAADLAPRLMPATPSQPSVRAGELVPA